MKKKIERMGRLAKRIIEQNDNLTAEKWDELWRDQVGEKLTFDEMMSLMNALDMVYLEDESGQGTWQSGEKRLDWRRKWLDEVLADDILNKAKQAFQGDTQTELVVPDDEGYVVEKFQSGIVTFRKDFKGGTPDYVTQINIHLAQLVSVTGEVKDWHVDEGVFGGNNASIERQSMNQYWLQLKQKLDDKAYGVINAEFFSTNDDPTSLAFPLIQSGKNVSDGYASNNEYQDPFQIETLNW